MASLRDLVVDDASLAEEQLAGVLEPYVQFAASGQLLLLPAFDGLSAERRVLCVLLSLQALSILEMRTSSDASPAEIADISGMAPGTVRPALSALLKARRVEKSGTRYSLPLHAARRAAAFLSESAR